MIRSIIALVLILMSSSAYAGDTTTNGYFYLPALGESYTTNNQVRNQWWSRLQSTDSILGLMRSANYWTNGANSTLTGDTDLASANLAVTGAWSFALGKFLLPKGTTLPTSDCDSVDEAGRIFIKTNATTGQQLYVCEGTTGWVLSSGSGSGGSGSGLEWDNDGSVIYSSDAFGNVGIGTFNPQYALDVSGAINGSALKVNGADVCLYGTDCGYASAGGWSDSGTSVYLTTTSDNIGVGTVNPAGKLHVSGGALVIEGSFSGMEMAYGQRITGDTSRKISFLDTTGTYNEDLRLDIDTTSNTAAWDSTTGITTWSSPDFTYVTGGLKSATSLNVGSSYYAVQTAPTNGAIIQGNVGIGTFSPTTNFQVVGNARITGLASNECVQTTTGGLLTTTGAACGSGGSGGVGVGTVNPGTIGAIPFYTAITTVDDSPVMFTDGTNIGIGTTGPTAKLQVVGTVAATAYTGDGSALTGLSANSGWTDGGTNVYTTTTTDRVGIGTTTPNSTTSLEIVKQSSNQPFKISSGATTNGDYLTVLSGGNVGIGTINPIAKAVVNSSDTTTYTATATGTANLSIVNPNTTVNNVAQVDYVTGNSAGALIPVVSTGSVTTDHTNGSEDGDYVVRTKLNGTFGERIRVMSSGAVGVGTNSPIGALNVVGDELRVGSGGTNTNATGAGELYVQNDLEVDGVIYGDGSGITGLGSGGWTDSGTIIYNATTSDQVAIGTTTPVSGAALTVFGTIAGSSSGPLTMTGGNVGIGTFSVPSVLLHVGSTVGSPTSVGSGDVYIQSDLEVDGTVYMASCSGAGCGGATGWTDSGTTVYTTTSTDNIGIGTSFPEKKLVLSGGDSDIRIRSTTASTYGEIQFYSDSGEAFNFGVGGSTTATPNQAFFENTISGAPMDFITNGGSMSFSGGNVGIGSTAPNAALDVRNTTSSIGWSIVAASNQACNTTCVAACVFGIDNDSTTNSLLGCTDTASDRCLCAGSN